MSEKIYSVAKDSAMDVAYILVGAFAMGYVKNFISNYTKWADEISLAVALAGTIYMKNKMVKDVFKGAAVASLLGLAQKYLGFSL